jgi:hypothetical protein
MTETDDARPAPAPPARRGAVTAAATLACLQAGVTAVTTVLVLLGARGAGSDGSAGEIGLGMVQAVGIALLLAGAVRLLRGARRSMLLAGCGLELVLCAYYLTRYASTGSAVVVIPVLLAVMPATSLLLASSRLATGAPAAGGRAVTAALALAHAGVTLVVTGVLILGLALMDDDGYSGSSGNTATPLVSTTAGDVVTDAGPGELWAVSLAQLAAVALLIVAGVRLTAGRAGALFPVAAGAQVVLCGYWLVRGADPMLPVTLLVLPVVALVPARRQARTPASTGI